MSSPHHPHVHAHAHHHDAGTAHRHTHGTVDPTILTTQRGLWAIKWSFVALGATALIQVVIVWMSGSVALLADTIHNVGDAATALPLWMAFVLARRPPSPRFTYGLGRAEDLAGVLIVVLILCSAIVAGYQSLSRLLNPQPIAYLGAVMAAAMIGFLGNEAVALLRLKVGKEIGSAALMADGYHARADGWTSLAVLVGTIGTWFGYPIVDPIVGCVITLAIGRIVWESGAAIFTRLLDGVEPTVTVDARVTPHTSAAKPCMRVSPHTAPRLLNPCHGHVALRCDLVMAVAVDEHKIVLLVILMIAIHMVDFHYVFLTKMEFAVAAFTMLLLEQSGSAWGEERIATQSCSPVHPISIKGRSASEDFDVSNNLCGIVSK